MDTHEEKLIIGSKANDSKSVVSDTVGNSEGQRALRMDILLYTNWTIGTWTNFLELSFNAQWQEHFFPAQGIFQCTETYQRTAN